MPVSANESAQVNLCIDYPPFNEAGLHDSGDGRFVVLENLDEHSLMPLRAKFSCGQNECTAVEPSFPMRTDRATKSDEGGPYIQTKHRVLASPAHYRAV